MRNLIVITKNNKKGKEPLVESTLSSLSVMRWHTDPY